MHLFSPSPLAEESRSQHPLVAHQGLPLPLLTAFFCPPFLLQDFVLAPKAPKAQGARRRAGNITVAQKAGRLPAKSPHAWQSRFPSECRAAACRRIAHLQRTRSKGTWLWDRAGPRRRAADQQKAADASPSFRLFEAVAALRRPAKATRGSACAHQGPAPHLPAAAAAAAAAPPGFSVYLNLAPPAGMFMKATPARPPRVMSGGAAELAPCLAGRRRCSYPPRLVHLLLPCWFATASPGSPYPDLQFLCPKIQMRFK